MTNKYRETMDKIVVSQELKAKIIRNAAENHLPATEEPPQRVTLFPRNIRRGVGYAACLLLCGVAISAGVGLFNESASILPDPASPNAPAISADTNIKVADDSAATGQDLPAAQAKASKPGRHSKVIKTDGKAQTPSANITDTNDIQVASVMTLSGEYSVGDDNNVGGDKTTSVRMVGNSANSQAAIREQLGHNFKTPGYIPQGYSLASADLFSGNLVQLAYESPDDCIVYRTKQTADDISNDSTWYGNITTEQVGGAPTTLKGNADVFHLATWLDADSSYSLSSDSGLPRDTFVSIIESVDYQE